MHKLLPSFMMICSLLWRSYYNLLKKLMRIIGGPEVVILRRKQTFSQRDYYQKRTSDRTRIKMSYASMASDVY